MKNYSSSKIRGRNETLGQQSQFPITNFIKLFCQKVAFKLLMLTIKMPKEAFKCPQEVLKKAYNLAF